MYDRDIIMYRTCRKTISKRHFENPKLPRRQRVLKSPFCKNLSLLVGFKGQTSRGDWGGSGADLKRPHFTHPKVHGMIPRDA
jgi:hypothetical protein